MSYERDTYTLFRYELVAPHVRNDGSESDYLFTVRGGLVLAGFTGWTEFNSCGYWLGKLEVGTTFVIYATEHRRTCPDHGDMHGLSWCEMDGCGKHTTAVPTAEILSKVARACMPDQQAIQIVKFPHPVELIEA